MTLRPSDEGQEAMDRETAQAIIEDHDSRPRNFSQDEQATHWAEGYDPFCGDRYTVRLHVADGRVAVARFHGYGCTLSKASASMLTEAVTGQSPAEARALADLLEDILLRPPSEDPERLHIQPLGEITSLLAVRNQPSRIKCVLLPWRALRAALDQHPSPSTDRFAPLEVPPRA